jgi:putative transposase
MAMLEGVTALRLALLNTATQAWVEQEYQRSDHSEIGQTPLARWLAGPQVLRECPTARRCEPPSAWRPPAPSGAATAPSA